MTVEISAAADRDIDDHFAYLVNQAGLDTAVRFLEAARHSFTDLAESPGLGEPQEFRSAELIGIRKWHVHRFRNFLIFYRVMPDRLRIIRVLHGSRDIPRIFVASIVEDAQAEEDA